MLAWLKALTIEIVMQKKTRIVIVVLVLSVAGIAMYNDPEIQINIDADISEAKEAVNRDVLAAKQTVLSDMQEAGQIIRQDIQQAKGSLDKDISQAKAQIRMDVNEAKVQIQTDFSEAKQELSENFPHLVGHSEEEAVGDNPELMKP